MTYPVTFLATLVLCLILYVITEEPLPPCSHSPASGA
jgi:hypothetical protein